MDNRNTIFVEIMKNQLFFGDCLEILEKYIVPKSSEGFIDLVYIDPPFNSKRDYNVLFESVDLTDSSAQKQAFADTWSNISYMDELDRIQNLNLDLYDFLKTLEKVKTPRSAVAYLTTMSLRIIYIHKVLKSTGSFYLHCDPTMSHYLKIVCDMIFGHANYRNEITWQRMYAHNDPVRYGKIHDVILYYAKSKDFTWNRIYTEYDDKYLKMYNQKDSDGKLYKVENTMAPGGRGPIYEWNGVTRAWRYTKENMQKLHDAGLLYYTSSGFPKKKQYLTDMKGRPLQDVWSDINVIAGMAKELLGYPTQKPIALLERIVKTSSNPGDIVADFFCGCGTTIAAAEKLGRNWIGVDISHLAVKLIIDRLLKPWDDNITKQKEIRDNIEITGVPKDIGSAKELARNTTKGRFNFQDWVIEFLLGGVCNPKKVGDGGYDGYITFKSMGGHKGLILIEVKSGNLTVKNIREFIQVIDKQGADMGVFVCFKDQVSSGMEAEARQVGYYMKEIYQERFQKIRIITIEQLLEGYQLNYPRVEETTFKKATKKLQIKQINHGDLFENEEGE